MILCTRCAGGAVFRWYCVHVVHIVLVQIWYCVHVIHVVLRACGTKYIHCVVEWIVWCCTLGIYVLCCVVYQVYVCAFCGVAHCVRMNVF